jgi:hypothetical protein
MLKATTFVADHLSLLVADLKTLTPIATNNQTNTKNKSALIISFPFFVVKIVVEPGVQHGLANASLLPTRCASVFKVNHKCMVTFWALHFYIAAVCRSVFWYVNMLPPVPEIRVIKKVYIVIALWAITS